MKGLGEFHEAAGKQALSMAEAYRELLDLRVENERLREALLHAVNLLENSRCDLGDPSLKRSWAQQRRALRGDPILGSKEGCNVSRGR